MKRTMLCSNALKFSEKAFDESEPVSAALARDA